MLPASAAQPPRRASGNVRFDPTAQPWQAAGTGLWALPSERLRVDFLRCALAEARNNDARNNAHRNIPPYPTSTPTLVDAAVLIALVARADTLHVVFTRRAEHLSDHAGQICFPGGRLERNDASAEVAALREAQEEIGLARGYVEVLGCLPRTATGSGFSVTPVVAAVQPGFTLAPDRAEVAEVFEAPLAFLLDPANHRLHRAVLPDGRVRCFYSMLWQEHLIWGATAAMLRNLYQALSAAARPVSPTPHQES